MRTYRRFIRPLLALYMHDQVKKLSSFGFKPTFGIPEKDPKILQSIERGDNICLPFSGVSTYNGKVAKYARKRNLSGKFDQLQMKSIVLPNGAVQATTKIVELFVCGIFVTLSILILPF